MMYKLPQNSAARVLAFAITAVASCFSIEVQAQGFSLSSEEADPKVMVVTGYGDISNFTGEAPTYKVFTAEGAANVSLKSGDSWKAINEGDVYNKQNKYGYSVPTYKPVGELTDELATSTTVWSTKSLANGQHIYPASMGTNKQSTSTQIGLPTETNDYIEVINNAGPFWGKVSISMNYGTYNVYVLTANYDYTSYTLPTATDGYVEVTTADGTNSYKCISDKLFVSTDGGKTKTKVGNGNTITVSNDNTYYIESAEPTTLTKGAAVKSGSSDFSSPSFIYKGTEYAGYFLDNNTGTWTNNCADIFSWGSTQFIKLADLPSYQTTTQYKSKTDDLYIGASEWSNTQIKAGETFGQLADDQHLYLKRTSYTYTVQGNEITDGSSDFSQKDMTFDDVTYAGYVISDKEMAAYSYFYKWDVTFIPKDQLANYQKKQYTATGNNLYGGTAENGSDRVLLNKFDEGTYSYFWTRENDWKDIENNETYFTENSSYLKDYTGEALAFLDAATQFASTNGCKAIRFEQDAAHTDEPLTLTENAVNSILDMQSTDQSGQKSAIFPAGNGKTTNYYIDFSKVTITGDDIPKGIKASSSNAVSVVLPNNLTSEQVTTINKKFATEGGILNVYWYTSEAGSSEKLLNVYEKNDAEVSTTQKLNLEENTKSIVVYTYNGYPGNTHFADYDIDGIDNIVLQYSTISPTTEMLNAFRHVKRVILANNGSATYLDNFSITDEDCSVGVLQFYCDNGSDDKVIVKVIKPGILGGSNGQALAHYSNAEYKTAGSMKFSGNVDAKDFEFFNSLETRRLDLGEIGLSSTYFADSISKLNAVKSIKNGNVEYLVLPDLNTDVSNLKEFFNDGNAKLKGIAELFTSDNTLSATLKDVPGTMDVLFGMMGSTKCAKVEKIKFSGDLNAKDITQNTNNTMLDDGTYNYLSKDGHYVTATLDADNKPIIPDNVDTQKQSGAMQSFPSNKITYVDFSEAVFAENHDLNFSLCGSALNKSNLKTILLPTDHTYTTIAHDCLSSLNPDKPFIIPGNVKVIETCAFYNNYKLSQLAIYTTKVDENNNGSYAPEDIINNGERSFTFPEGLTKIGTKAFWNCDHVHDVYVLAKKAPVCERDAFDSNSYTGNNGFNGSKGVSQDAYMREDRSFAVLHYPSDIIGTDEEKKYTDITRVYTLQDNTGATDANGKPLLWPSQEEWNHAYATAYLGYLWGAWDKSLSTADNELDFADLSSDKAKQNAETFYKANGSPADAVYSDFVGWHQFILSNRMNGVKGKTEPVRDLSRYKTNDWYTICVPYNIRKKDLQKAFGVVSQKDAKTVSIVAGNGEYKTVDVPEEGLYPQVVTLVGVKRDEANSTITLIFSKDLVKTDVTINAEGKAPTYSEYNDTDEPDNPVIIKEGHPYLIRPYMPESALTLDKKVSIAENSYDKHNTYPGRPNLRIPFNGHIVKATDGKSTDGSNYGAPLDDWTYRFGGAYADHDSIPAYSYYLSRSKSKQKNIWFYLDSKTKKRAWNMYSAVIVAKPKDDIYIPEEAEILKGKNPIYLFTGESDNFTDVPKSKTNYVMTFDEDNGSTTGIRDISNNSKEDAVEYIDGKAILTDSNAKVYNISGQYVGNSLSGLAKGIYIVNGNKYVVK